MLQNSNLLQQLTSHCLAAMKIDIVSATDKAQAHAKITNVVNAFIANECDNAADLQTIIEVAIQQCVIVYTSETQLLRQPYREMALVRSLRRNGSLLTS
jgi:hypothetical protein